MASLMATVGGVSGSFAPAFVSAGGLCGPAVVGGLFLATARRPGLAPQALIMQDFVGDEASVDEHQYAKKLPGVFQLGRIT